MTHSALSELEAVLSSSEAELYSVDWALSWKPSLLAPKLRSRGRASTLDGSSLEALKASLSNSVHREEIGDDGTVVTLFTRDAALAGADRSLTVVSNS